MDVGRTITATISHFSSLPLKKISTLSIPLFFTISLSLSPFSPSLSSFHSLSLSLLLSLSRSLSLRAFHFYRLSLFVAHFTLSSSPLFNPLYLSPSLPQFLFHHLSLLFYLTMFFTLSLSLSSPSPSLPFSPFL
jgi:hypothetical protein